MNEDRHRHSGRSDLKLALGFGIVAATIQMAAILWLMYC